MRNRTGRGFRRIAGRFRTASTKQEGPIPSFPNEQADGRGRKERRAVMRRSVGRTRRPYSPGASSPPLPLSCTKRRETEAAPTRLAAPSTRPGPNGPDFQNFRNGSAIPPDTSQDAPRREWHRPVRRHNRRDALHRPDQKPAVERPSAPILRPSDTASLSPDENFVFPVGNFLLRTLPMRAYGISYQTTERRQQRFGRTTERRNVPPRYDSGAIARQDRSVPKSARTRTRPPAEKFAGNCRGESLYLRFRTIPFR